MKQNIEQVANWILKQHPEIKSISYEIDLIENRLIDSLRFMELIFHIEHLSGQHIDTNTLNIEDFRTINNIANKFLIKESQ